MKRILFITQNLGRTGSELVLWHLLKELNPAEYSAYVFCLKKGELYNTLPNHIQKSVLYKASGKWNKKVLRTILKLLGKDPVEYQLKYLNQHFKPDSWYINTLAIPAAHQAAAKLGVKVITHLHELEYAFTFITHQQFNIMLQVTDNFIGCSETVCQKIKDLGKSNVRLQHSFIDLNTINPSLEKVASLKKQLGITPEDFVWVVSGATTYMKGFDNVLPIFENFPSKNIKILWIGRKIDDGLTCYVEEVASTKFPGRLILTGSLAENYIDYMAIANGLLLLSKEESFSLVILEAAAIGIPTVAFNVGLAEDFIQEGMGEVISEGNKERLFAAMKRLHDNPKQNSKKLKEEAAKYGSDYQLPKFQNLLTEIS